jgi:FkbM family methyltransferase
LKKILRRLFRMIFKHYKREYGKYTILNKLFFKYLISKGQRTEIIKVEKNIKIDLDPSEFIQAHLYVFNTFEPATIKLLQHTLKVGGIVFDIGANIGYHSLIISKLVGDTGKIYSFEPDELNFKRLTRNIELNNLTNIEAHKNAISDSNQTLKFYKSKSNNFGGHSLIFNEEFLNPEFNLVEAITLDSFCEAIKPDHIDLLKIDVEGAELDALKGMQNVISQYSPMIILELNDLTQSFRNLPKNILEQYLLEHHNYIPYSITDNGYLKEFSEEHKLAVDNVAFISNSKLDKYKHLY